jgi:transposase-like protein
MVAASGWYLCFGLSYRNLEELMAERNLNVPGDKLPLGAGELGSGGRCRPVRYLNNIVEQDQSHQTATES